MLLLYQKSHSESAGNPSSKWCLMYTEKLRILRISHIGAPIISDHVLFFKLLIFWPEIISIATTLPKIAFWICREPFLKMAFNVYRKITYFTNIAFWCAHNFRSRAFFQNPDFLARDSINCYYSTKNRVLNLSGIRDKNGV